MIGHTREKFISQPFRKILIFIFFVRFYFYYIGIILNNSRHIMNKIHEGKKLTSVYRGANKKISFEWAIIHKQQLFFEGS